VPSEAAISRPIVPLDQLVDQVPDGGHIVELYQAARTVQDVEAANATVKAQVNKAQSIAADVARVHAADFKSCADGDVARVQAIGAKTRGLSVTLVQIDSERTNSLAAMQQKATTGVPASTRAKEDVNRFMLATHELGRFRVQAQEIAKTVESLGVVIRATAAPCTPTPLPPLFADRDSPPIAAAPANRAPTSSPKGTNRSVSPAAPSPSWQE
jgi:hypothetical protein